MKLTLSWLREHLDGDAPLADVLAALNDCGLEVEGVTDPAAKLGDFTIAEVLTAAPHPAGRQAPGADRRHRQRAIQSRSCAARRTRVPG